MAESPDVTLLLRKVSEGGSGDENAPEKLLSLVYDELRKLAHGYMRNEREDHTLQATALVHEAYIRLIDWQNVSWENRAHFFAVAAQVMRRILVDYARQKNANKRDFGQKIALYEAVSFIIADVTISAARIRHQSAGPDTNADVCNGTGGKLTAISIFEKH